METNISQKYINLLKGAKCKAYRRPMDIKRDELISILKTLLHYNAIRLNNYLIYSSKFRLDKSLNKGEFTDIYLNKKLNGLNYHLRVLLLIYYFSFTFFRFAMYIAKIQIIDF